MRSQSIWNTVTRGAGRTGPAWTCRNCLRAQNLEKKPTSLSSLRRYATEVWRPTIRRTDIPPPKSKKGWYIVGGAVIVGAGALGASEDARYVWAAAQRSARVAGTLAVCVNDYRVTLKQREDTPPDQYAALLKACHKRCAERTLVVLEKNGSIFIKLGQHLSSLNYLLPSEWCDTFIPLQDKCPVSSIESIEQMVYNDTGRQLSDFFETFDPNPIGAASLAQVHIATLKGTGERVAVKMQHPALDEWAKLDLALTRFTFSTLKRFFPEYDLTWLSEEMEVSLPKELDFALEGFNAQRAREYFANVRNTPLIIPEVKWAQRRILVMEYVTGHRPDDLAYLDSHNISRDEVSAALARIFNEMIFGHDAPLHCDPHGGNIAIRENKNRRYPHNFDVVLYDHGLYRTPDMGLRRAYAKLWLAVIDADEARMRRYAREVAGITDQQFPLFASAITGRDYRVVTQSVAKVPRSSEEKEAISDALGHGMLEQLVQMLGSVPRVILLILKTNDLTRSLDEGLQTREGAVRTFLILARYAARCVYEEQVERIGSLWRVGNLWRWVVAWSDFERVELKLGVYEVWLRIRRVFGGETVL